MACFNTLREKALLMPRYINSAIRNYIAGNGSYPTMILSHMSLSVLLFKAHGNASEPGLISHSS